MPELPEVETIRAAIEPALVGRRLDRVEILDERLTRPLPPREVVAALEGERIAAVRRRGKYLVLLFESGRALVVHLRMTGSLRHARELPVDAHRRALAALDDGTLVAYRDVRRFGTWVVLEPPELEAYFAERLGEEPLGPHFTPRLLGERLAGRRAPVKAALLDQRALAGMGNIYADEALWRARIHPLRPAGSLDRREVARLHRAAIAALEAGIARQGATLRDYAAPNGAAGTMQDEFRVYGRTGRPCPRCGTPIEKIRAAGRGTWLCPTCQPASP